MCEAWGLAMLIQGNMLSPLKEFIALVLLPLISILIVMFFCSFS